MGASLSSQRAASPACSWSRKPGRLPPRPSARLRRGGPSPPEPTSSSSENEWSDGTKSGRQPRARSMPRTPRPALQREVPRHGQTRSFTFGLPLRVFFGNQATSLFLGASPTFVFRSTDPVVGATAQIGMRVLGTAGNTTWVPVSDVKFFAEPRFTFDGTTTAVLFGLEVGLGAGHKSLTDTSLTWALVPAPPSDP